MELLASREHVIEMKWKAETNEQKKTQQQRNRRKKTEKIVSITVWLNKNGQLHQSGYVELSWVDMANARDHLCYFCYSSFSLRPLFLFSLRAHCCCGGDGEKRREKSAARAMKQFIERTE